jgi:IPT/TIG domain-containing protein
VGSISALRGKTVRVKVPFVTRPTSTTESVRVAVGYHIPRGDDTPTTPVTLTATPTMVKPGATITATARADVPAYRANNLYMTLSRGACTVTSLEHTTRDGRTLNTDTVVSGGYDSKENWTLGEVGYWWSTSQRSLVWTLQAPSSSRVTTVSVTLRGDTSGTDTDSVVICVDGSAPSTPSGVKCTTHTANTWTNQRGFTVIWPASSDSGCAGMQGYGGGLASSCPKIISPNLGNTTTYSTTLPTSSGAKYYFAVKAFDKVANGSGTTCIGPFLLDTVAPASGTISINNGASSTTSLVVTLNNLGASESGSGLYRMRFSNNGSTWSSWQTYTSTRTGWDLSAYGGNTSGGTKRVYVQYRDQAGNTSGSYSDTITYTALGVSSVSPASGTLIGNDLVTVYGQGFASGIRVYFDGVAATSVSVASSTRLTCRTPRHLVWERVDVRVTLGSATDTLLNGYEYVGADIQASGDPQLGVLFPIVFNAPVDPSRSYVAAASFGKGPIPLPPHNDLRLTPDSLFYLTVANAIPTVFGGMRGTLNSSGQAKGTVVLPRITAIVGLNFYMAFVTLDASKPLGIRTVSNGKGFRISKD